PREEERHQPGLARDRALARGGALHAALLALPRHDRGGCARRGGGARSRVPGVRERAPVSETVRLPPPETVLVRYGEIALKGGNRRQFETALCRNIQAAAKRISPVRIERRQGRLAVVPEARTADR